MAALDDYRTARDVADAAKATMQAALAGVVIASEEFKTAADALADAPSPTPELVAAAQTKAAALGVAYAAHDAAFAPYREALEALVLANHALREELS